MVGRLSWRFGSGLDTLPEVRKWSGDPPEGPEVIGRPVRCSGNGWETPRWSGSGQKTLPVVQM